MIDSTLKNARILIVDDKESNIDILEELLEESGYKYIKSTNDSRQVLDLFNSFSPDLILLDLMMPYLSGYEVMDQLKGLIAPGSFVPILVLTADITPEAKLRALSGGAKDFLSKPFNFYEIKLRINNLLETKYLYQQLGNQNQILEKMVKERTNELELSNKALIIEKEKAQESNRLKTAFLKNISHEIRTPLNGILGFAPLVIQPDIKQEDKEMSLKYLNLSSKRLLNTITDTMDMSLIITGNIEINTQPIDFTSIIQKIQTSYSEPCAKKNLELIISEPAHYQNINFKTDKELLIKSLSHIMNNSLRFTSVGSITVGCELKDDQLIFHVKDTGIGIDKNAQKRIWDIFMQEDYSDTRMHDGIGLGLSISAGLIKLMGGKIHLESEKLHGTNVFISLPVEQSITKKSPDFNQKKNDLRALTSILIAEDDESNNSFLKLILENLAPVLISARSGKEVVEICHNTPDIDLILMDILIPEINGYEATRQIRQFNKDVVIIAQTAYGLNGDREKAIKAGCNDYIAKPINKDELYAIIHKYFHE
jgi:two-component system sensor histidine kinase/response regulator